MAQQRRYVQKNKISKRNEKYDKNCPTNIDFHQLSYSQKIKGGHFMTKEEKIAAFINECFDSLGVNIKEYFFFDFEEGEWEDDKQTKHCIIF